MRCALRDLKLRRLRCSRNWGRRYTTAMTTHIMQDLELPGPVKHPWPPDTAHGSLPLRVTPKPPHPTPPHTHTHAEKHVTLSRLMLLLAAAAPPLQPVVADLPTSPQQTRVFWVFPDMPSPSTGFHLYNGSCFENQCTCPNGFLTARQNFMGEGTLSQSVSARLPAIDKTKWLG